MAGVKVLGATRAKSYFIARYFYGVYKTKAKEQEVVHINSRW